MFGKVFEGLSVLPTVVVITSRGVPPLLQGRIIFNPVISLYTFCLEVLPPFGLPRLFSRALGHNQTGIVFVLVWGAAVSAHPSPAQN